MQQSPDIAPADSAPTPRGVHSYQEQPSGETVYFAVTSDGLLLNAEIRRRLDGETDAMILDEMRRDLERQDPVGTRVIGPPRLSVASGGQHRLGRRVGGGPPRPA